jgi:ribose 1,5-bisphosphokinase
VSPERVPSPGILLAVVGPSGAGKDTLLRMALDTIGREPRLRLAQRVITRPPDGATEDHASCSITAFEQGERTGAFCLTWRAHGLAYGLPCEIERDLEAGSLVVANLSRRSLREAAERFGRLAVAEITAPDHVLVERIRQRGRETAEEIARRLSRQAPLVLPPGTVRSVRIDNSGSAQAGAERLASHMRELLDLLPETQPAAGV